VSGLTAAVAAGRRQYETRTTGGAHLYRVTQYYDSWPFEHDSRVPHGSKSRRRTETFRALEPVRRRLARANGHARYQQRNGGDWSAFVAVAEQLTDDGWQPLDVDFPPPRPPRARRGRTRHSRHSRHGGAPVTAGRHPATRLGDACGSGPPGTEGEQRPLEPVYLSRVLTVEAELSAGRLYDGSTHQENASPVLAALVFIGGTAMLFTEDESGQLTRLRIPGPAFLRLIDDAGGKLTRSQQPDQLGEPGDPSPICKGKEPGRP
jgi:hypothetical protein